MKRFQELTHAELQAVTQLVRSTRLDDLTPEQSSALDRVLAVKPWEPGPDDVRPCWAEKADSTAWSRAVPQALELRAALFAAARIPDPHSDNEGNEADE